MCARLRASSLCGRRRATCVGRWVALCYAALASLGPGAAAQSGSADPFSALVGRRAEAGPQSNVQRFVTAAHDRVFLFEDRGVEARLKFLCGEADPRVDCRIDDDAPAEEIFRLSATLGPRGVAIYKDESGRALLRLTPYGHATVYWPGDAAGRAATKSFSEDPPLELWPAGRTTAAYRAKQATAMLSAEIGAPVVFVMDAARERRSATPAPAQGVGFNAVDATAADDAASVASFAAPAVAPAAAEVLALDPAAARLAAPAGSFDQADPNAAEHADAVARVANAMHRLAEDEAHARRLQQRLKRVVFEAGAEAGAAWQGSDFVVAYAPGAGLDGRLSSAAVSAFLRESL